ncbi:hypothetical protein AK812_SmicGene2180 [Symbiodinium microadriaticum]|uniref:Uncharacterized protein n=1 Tax=Symbiodinium microadriaticum TaxID=2951 RepID=A0A1Q9F296_SYMMI|nr:hypothetical protein AK812_SmicGene2180 [Symbiodinium microadriaticum]
MYCADVAPDGCLQRAQASSSAQPGQGWCLYRSIEAAEGSRIVIFSNQHGPGRQRTMEAMQAEVRDITDRFDDS